MNNNIDKNREYFKSTFKVFHAPDNLTKEVLNMAENLNNQNIDGNIKDTQETIVTHAERSTNKNFTRLVAIVCSCVLIIGGGIYFNGINGGVTTTNNNSIGTSDTQSIDDKLFGRFDMPSKVRAKLLAHSSENPDIISYLTSQDLTKLNALMDYQNWEELSTYPAEFDNDVMYPYFAELDFQTNDGEYIRLEIIDQYVLIYYTDENYEHYSNVEYYQYDFTNDTTFFETFKQLVENNATQPVDNVQTSTNTKFMGMFNASNITISYQQKDKNNYTINDLIKSNISADDVDLINSAIDLNTCTEIDENTFRERNPKYNENLLNSDINLDNASIKFTDGNKLFNIYIVNDVMIITHFTSNGEIRLYDGYYSIENTTLLDTINSIVNVDEVDNTDSNQEVQYVGLFGVVEIPTNATVYYSTSSDDLHYNSETENYTDEIEFSGTLNAQAIQKINELSDNTLWTKTDEPPYAGESVISINLNDSYSGYGCSFAMYDNGIAITYEDNTEEYYIADENLIQQIISVIDEYAEPTTFQTDSHNLFGIIPMDENTTVNAINTSSTGGESGCILNYFDLLKINELSNYNMWQKLDSNPINQDFSYEIAISLKNENYSIQILDTTIIVTYPDGTVEYYSTMETCGTDTFAQRVQALMYEKPKSIIVD